jgi:hypothetical protein
MNPDFTQKLRIFSLYFIPIVIILGGFFIATPRLQNFFYPKPSGVKIILLQGKGTISSKDLGDTELTEGTPFILKLQDTLHLEKDSTAAILFQNNHLKPLTGKNTFVLQSVQSNNDAIEYRFLDTNVNTELVLTDTDSGPKQSTAMIVGKESEQDKRVLGVVEKKIDDADKYEIINQVSSCLDEDKNQDFSENLHHCLSKTDISSLSELEDSYETHQ